MKYYVAYGSNMNISQMRFRCPDATPVGAAIIRGYVLRFSARKIRAVANIEYTGNNTDTVPVALWAISSDDEYSLDAYEGYPRLYTKKTIPVELSNGSNTQAMVYVLTEAYEKIIGVPNAHYYQTILEGYKDFGIEYTSLIDNAEVQDMFAAILRSYNGNKCPRCGDISGRLLALSRRADVCICDKCGTEEALADWEHKEDTISNWEIIKNIGRYEGWV